MTQPENNHTTFTIFSRQQLSAFLARITDQIVSGWASKLFVGIFMIISVAIIAQILHSNWDTFKTLDWEFRPIWLFFIIIFFIIDLLVATWVWHLLVTQLANYSNFQHSAKICWSTNLARRIPTPVWYIAGRAVMYEQVGVSKITTSLLSTLELIFFFLSGLATTLLTLPFWVIPSDFISGEKQFGLLFLLLPFSLLLVHPRLLETIWRRLRPDSPMQPLHWRNTITWMGYYILTWILGAFVLFSVINLFYPVPLTSLIVIIGVWSLAGTVSLAGALTISFFGVREISLTLLLTILVPMPVALIVAILIRVVWLLGETFSALISFKLK